MTNPPNIYSKPPVRDLEAKLDQDERELNRISDPIPQAIIVMNPDGKAVYPGAGSCVHSAASWCQQKDELVFTATQTFNRYRPLARLASALPHE